MNLQEFAKLLRVRWITVAVTALVGMLIALAYSLFTTPLYEASTRLFVSTSEGASLSDLYQGNRLSQERVLSYTELLTGETLARRTIDKLGLQMSPDTLREEVSATAKPGTVLIDVVVLDQSPVRASDIANALSDEFVLMASELETPKGATANSDARVVVEQRATTPTEPAVPQTWRNLGIGLAIGILLGVALAVVRDRLDNGVKNRESVEHITGVGLVGSIPLDKERRKEPAIAFDNDNSPPAEAFRKLRTNLQFLQVDNPPRLIVVSSSLPSEGKTTTSINIALALAEADHNVAIVDGDMRRPMIDKYLGLVGPVGFSSVLSGAIPLTEALQQTRYPRLTALTAGVVPPNPSELLGSLAAEKVLADLREQFDYVIVDSSPLLAVTDASILAASSDGALIMVRHGETKREQLAHAVRNLNDVGATVIGAVFTMTPARGSSSYNYDYSYNYRGADDSSPLPSTPSTGSETAL